MYRGIQFVNDTRSAYLIAESMFNAKRILPLQSSTSGNNGAQQNILVDWLL